MEIKCYAINLCYGLICIKEDEFFSLKFPSSSWKWEFKSGPEVVLIEKWYFVSDTAAGAVGNLIYDPLGH